MGATLATALHLETDTPDLDLEEAEPIPAGHSTEPAIRRRRFQWRSTGALAGGLGLAILVAAGGYRWWAYARIHVSTDNAFITGTIHQMGSRVAGTVVEMLVADNQRVAPGTPLFKLDARDFELRVQQAEHQVGQAAARVTQAAAQLEQSTAQLAQAEAKSGKAAAEWQKGRLDYERAQKLTEAERFAAMSRQEFDAAKAAFEVAQAATDLARAELESSTAAVASARAAKAVAEAQRRTAEVALADARLQLSYTTIVAPAAGTVGRKSVETGQRVQPGQALLAIVSDEKWVTANFKETQLARMRAGQRVSVKIDAIPGHRFSGRIESFSPASGAQFALLPPDNATGNFTRIVQRVPVKIVFDPCSLRGFESRLVPGLSAIVDVNVAQHASTR